MWIKGSELLDPPYKFTRLQVFNFVRTGQLIPRVVDNTSYPDPIDPPGSHRYFWLDDDIKAREKLRHIRYQAEWKKNWLSRPDDRHRSQFSQDEIDQGRNHYPEEIKKAAEEIRILEESLRPDRVWSLAMLPNIQEEIIGKLAGECIYWKAENDILVQLGNIIKAPRKTRVDRDIARDCAKAYWNQELTLSTAKVAERIQGRHSAEGLFRKEKGYAIKTILGWIRDLNPAYSKGKPGSKKKTA